MRRELIMVRENISLKRKVARSSELLEACVLGLRLPLDTSFTAVGLVTGLLNRNRQSQYHCDTKKTLRLSRKIQIIIDPA